MADDVEIDVSEIINLSGPGMDSIIDEVTDIQREITLAVWTNIVSGRYPVDTGRSRGGWIATVKKPSLHVPPETEGKNSTPFPGLPTGLEATKLEDLNFVVNNVDYTIYLNEGTSDQAPPKFVETAIALTLAAYR